MREQKLARVIDREVAPIWHDRFARLLLRELPGDPETFALDVHSGPGHTTAELLQRLGESSRIVALGRDPWLMQVSKTRVRPEWKRRVYFKSGDIDDVTGMADDTYNLSVANLVLGEQVVEWQPALAELVRVTKPGGQVLVTLPLFGTWREVENMFEEMLRDEGMRREVGTLQQLRRRRPKPSQLVEGLHKIGLSDNDYVVEHDRFELLFRSGREFLFAPVIEHGPLRLWKAIIGRAEKPQALFWRFKETIDTYYSDHVLAVSVIAGLVRIRVPGEGGSESFAAKHWSRYPTLARLWGGPGAEALDASEDDFEFDLDIDLDEAEAAIDALSPARASADPMSEPSVEVDISGLGFADAHENFADIEVSGVNELPALEDAALSEDDDPFAGLLDELDAEEAVAAELAAEDAEVEAAAVQPRERQVSGRAATLGAMDHSPLPGKLPSRPGDSGSRPRLVARKPGESGASPLPGKLPARKPGESGASPLPGKLPARKPDESGASPLPGKLPSRAGESGASPLPGKLPARKPGESGASPLPGKLPARKPGESGALPTVKGKLKLPGRKAGGKLSDRLPRRTSSGVTPIPPGLAGDIGTSDSDSDSDSADVAAPGQAPRKPRDTKSLLARLPKRGETKVGKKPPAPPPMPPAPAAIVNPKPAPLPTVTKAGEEDPFASMLDDDDELDDDLELIDDLEAISAEPLDPELDEEDFADSFGDVSPDSSRSSPPPIPPPPPKTKK